MANLFNKAAAKPKSAPSKSKSKETVWLLGQDQQQQQELAQSVRELNRLHKETKALEAQADIHKNVLKQYAEQQYLRAYAAMGVEPERPMTIQDSGTGQKVTYVVQDRSGGKLKEDQLQDLEALLGAGAVAEITYQETKFGFNTLVMAQPVADGSTDEEGQVRLVQDVVGEAISEALSRLQQEGVISEQQLDELLTCEQAQTLRPGTLSRLAEVCRRSVPLMQDVLAALGSLSVRYIKAG